MNENDPKSSWSTVIQNDNRRIESLHKISESHVWPAEWCKEYDVWISAVHAAVFMEASGQAIYSAANSWNLVPELQYLWNLNYEAFAWLLT